MIKNLPANAGDAGSILGPGRPTYHGATKPAPTTEPVCSDCRGRVPSPWNFPGKNIGVGCHFLFQAIFPTQGLNSSLLCLWYWQAEFLPLLNLESPPYQVKGLFLDSPTLKSIHINISYAVNSNLFFIIYRKII